MMDMKNILNTKIYGYIDLLTIPISDMFAKIEDFPN